MASSHYRLAPRRASETPARRRRGCPHSDWFAGSALAAIAVGSVPSVASGADVDADRRGVARIDDDAIVRRQRPEHAHAGLYRHGGAVEVARLDARRARLDA